MWRLRRKRHPNSNSFETRLQFYQCQVPICISDNLYLKNLLSERKIFKRHKTRKDTNDFRTDWIAMARSISEKIFERTKQTKCFRKNGRRPRCRRRRRSFSETYKSDTVVNDQANPRTTEKAAWATESAALASDLCRYQKDTPTAGKIARQQSMRKILMDVMEKFFWTSWKFF